jgi:hypothetical protein
MQSSPCNMYQTLHYIDQGKIFTLLSNIEFEQNMRRLVLDGMRKLAANFFICS